MADKKYQGRSEGSSSGRITTLSQNLSEKKNVDWKRRNERGVSAGKIRIGML